MGLSWVLVRTQQWHGKHSQDTTEGPQKFHTGSIPRVGGIAMFFALVVSCFVLPKSTVYLFAPMLAAGLPVFAAGMIEDFTKKVSVPKRLLAAMASGIVAWWLTGYRLTHLEIFGIDALLVYLPVSVLFTSFAVAGVVHAINMIDGFNGLAAGTLMILFSAFGVIALAVADVQLAQLCLTLIVVLSGFLVFNFPFGKIFMGDGGAYLLGFMLAWVAVMLPMRNPQVSVWAPLLVCAYPVNEAFLTMGRRYLDRVSLGLPDSNHLHSLIKKKIVRVHFGHLSQIMRNSLVSPFCWAYAALCSSIAVWQYRDTNFLIATWFISFVLYVFMYTLLTRVATTDGLQ